MSNDTHQAADNVPHISYFNKEHNVSFVWNGTKGNRVDVCPGGYAEAVDDSFTMNLAFNPQTIPLVTALNYFAEDCEAWIKRFMPSIPHE